MLDFDATKLRAQVIHDFQLLAHGITDAEEMDRFTDAVMSTAVGTVREQLHAVNQDNRAARLPPAVLVACFTHLPFSYRIRPTHVCRSWRAAALSEPALWSYVSPSSPAACTPHMLSTALSRAGDLPVELRVISQPGTTPEAIYAAIAPFSRQLRYLAWHCAPPAHTWDFPAPRMEYFCSSSTVTMSDGSFGGQIGRLRGMYIQAVHFPSTCPALSTVLDLSVALTPYGDDTPSTISNLFDLFPRLERLQILGIRGSASHMLPTGPAPSSLRELALHGENDDYDLTPHLAWDSGNVRHITLTQYLGRHPNLERLARGTVKLAISRSEYDCTSLMFEHSAAVSHSISLPRSAIGAVAALLCTTASFLGNVQCAIVSDVALGPLAAFLVSLPKLEHLVIHVEPVPQRPGRNWTWGPPVFDWRPLSCLADIARAARGLRAVTVQVWCGSRYSSHSPSADDARGLIAQLLALPRAVPRIEIQGFSADVVASIDATGLAVRFDVAAKVGKLVLWERERTCYPFHYGG